MKKTKYLISGLLISSLLSGCVNFSYGGTTKADTTYVAEYADGTQVELSREEVEDIKEVQEELGIIEESLYEEKEEEVEEKTAKEPFNINTATH